MNAWVDVAARAPRIAQFIENSITGLMSSLIKSIACAALAAVLGAVIKKLVASKKASITLSFHPNSYSECGRNSHRAKVILDEILS